MNAKRPGPSLTNFTRKLMRWIPIAALFGVTSLYSNCSQLASMTGQVAAAQTSQCVAQNTVHALAAYSIADVCENANNYVCNQFATDTAQAPGQQEECADVSGWGRECVSVDIAPATATTQNAFHCANTELSSPGAYLLQADAGSLGDALSAVLAKCRARSL
jgi:hypothetical protein